MIQEEECVIDNLLKEIRQGFQLKKRKLSSVGVMSPDQARKLSKALLQEKNQPGNVLKESVNGKVVFAKTYMVTMPSAILESAK